MQSCGLTESIHKVHIQQPIQNTSGSCKLNSKNNPTKKPVSCFTKNDYTGAQNQQPLGKHRWKPQRDTMTHLLQWFR